MSEKVFKTMDGNEACATVAYHFTEVAAIFPITPSSPMSEKVDEWSAAGRKNMFGQQVTLVEMQSEAGAAGALHGVAEAGALATTFTSSQGLLLMIPNMYIMTGHRMPSVFHIAARSVAQHANNIFGDHQDVMSCRPTGVCMFATSSVQEVMDLAAIAHLTTIKTRIPFVHFFDGFRTSHEIQKIEMIDLKEVEKLLDKDALESFHQIAMNPEHPLMRTSVQGPDVYYQELETNNKTYDEIPALVEGYLEGINRITGRDYHIFNYYGAPDAERVMVVMGSACQAAEEVVDYLTAKGEKVGLLQVHLYRPFSIKDFLNAIPKTVKKITAMDRSREGGAIAGALYLDTVAAFANMENAPKIYGGRYGLASKDVTPAQLKAVFDNMKEDGKQMFTIGVNDDVTFLSLDVKEPLITESDDTISCKFWGLGSDGTVGANKNSAKIIGDHAGKYTQAYFEYDTKKSYGITKSHLRFSSKPIRSTYLIKAADFLACHSQSYINRYDMIHEIKDGGTFLFNTSWSEAELDEKLPAEVKKYIAEHNVQMYIVDAYKIAKELGLGNHANLILQSAFFKLANVMPIEDAVKYMKDAAKKTYAKKGEKVVNMNLAAVDAGLNSPVKVNVPESWKNATDDKKVDDSLPEFVKNVVIPCNRQRGDDLPVSAFMDHYDGTFELGTSKYDKRGIAPAVPVWNPEKCLQCNQCTFVCPHAAIRPFLLDEEEAANAPEGYKLADAKGAKGLKYHLQVSTMDCSGCGSCACSCLAKDKAIEMVPIDEKTMADETDWNYSLSLKDKLDVYNRKTLKGSQFYQPLVEFSGACAGCGETPYAKLLTQLFGEKTYWVNGVGCSLAWAGAFPSLPYTKNKEGRGPAFYGTLFEDQAENGLGVVLANKQHRAGLKMRAERLLELGVNAELTEALKGWLETFDDLDKNTPAAETLKKALKASAEEGEAKDLIDFMKLYDDRLAKKIVWLFGGDGWAYDIGYGGLDHVIASGEDINIFVVDTEVYSNTGGQSSKATPVGASAKFADGGKKTAKKDLGRLMMSYPNVYVASVAMGASSAQLVNACNEAAAHKGPSIIIAYAPCINHGIKAGMNNVQAEMKKAVDCGLWPLYRYNPDKTEKPFSLDYKKPTLPVSEFLNGEVRYAGLKLKFPEIAEQLFAEAQEQADKRYKDYVILEKSYNEV
ncbi:MAG: pyruvate:ferredoxin (flavodoxin) oxidoreductase [Clostridia bacterium]|nr:pyruvate:ferredoxin (flavodoxin) oxidoreductase [Clostridia bacterium]